MSSVEVCEAARWCVHTTCLSLKSWIHCDEDLHDGNELDLQKKAGAEGPDDDVECRWLEDAHFSCGYIRKHFSVSKISVSAPSWVLHSDVMFVEPGLGCNAKWLHGLYHLVSILSAALICFSWLSFTCEKWKLCVNPVHINIPARVHSDHLKSKSSRYLLIIWCNIIIWKYNILWLSQTQIYPDCPWYTNMSILEVLFPVVFLIVLNCKLCTLFRTLLFLHHCRATSNAKYFN